jgi:hypothetical protein
MFRQAEILRRLRRACRDDVPAGAAAADVIQRSEQARQIVRLGVGRRSRCDQADPRGGRGNCREQSDRLEPETRRVTDVVGEYWAIGEEDRIELVRFGALRQLLIVGDVEDTFGCRCLVAPGSLVMTVRIDEEVEGKLPSFAHVCSPCVSLAGRALRANTKRR